MPQMTPHRIAIGLLTLALTVSAGCRRSGNGPGPDMATGSTQPTIKYVFVIAMENHDANEIYGNTVDAPYINGTLIPQYARATNFTDELPSAIPSEPHYVWMEAGTNAFTDYTFTNDANPSASNSTASTQHLVTQIRNATSGITWMSYQEGIDATTGACPIESSGFYYPKHDPFIFFQDVAGNPPSKTNPYCVEHHKELGALAADLASKTVATYNFITPDQCNDMHGQAGCPDSNTIRSGDNWLQANLPALIAFCNANAGVVLITWDEGEQTTLLPFLAVGPHVKSGYTATRVYTHSAMLKSIEEILQLPLLPTVASDPDLADLFEPGYFP